MKKYCAECNSYKDENESKDCFDNQHLILDIVKCRYCNNKVGVMVDSGLGCVDDIVCMNCLERVMKDVS